MPSAHHRHDPVDLARRGATSSQLDGEIALPVMLVRRERGARHCAQDGRANRLQPCAMGRTLRVIEEKTSSLRCGAS
jgi:hypothetical protein